MLPIDNNILKLKYMIKKWMKHLVLDYVMIHACINDCILYWQEH